MIGTKKPHILVIDDDKETIKLIQDYLVLNGYRITCVLNGHRITRLLQENNFDLIILDVMLPGTDGLALCQLIRKTLDIPILMLSAAHSTADRVAGLELGADDYIPKPFSARELLARIKAHLRRMQGELQVSNKRLNTLGEIKFNEFTLDRETHALMGADKIAILLSRKEYELLIIFLEYPNRILSRDQLIDLLYDKLHDPQDRSIDVLIGRLRKKLEKNPKNPQILTTIRGGGYQFKGQIFL